MKVIINKLDMKKEKLNQEIADLQAGIDSPATPEAQKAVFRKIMEKLKAQSEPKPSVKMEKEFGKDFMASKDKGTIKQYPSKPKSKPLPKSTNTGDVYDCDELIKKEKEAKAKRKANADKRAKESKKTPATVNKEKIEKVADKVEHSIKKRLEKGEVSMSELDKLIDETKDLLNILLRAKETLKK